MLSERTKAPMQFAIFSDLTPPEFELVIGAARERRFGRRETIFTEGDPVRQVSLVVSGFVKVTQMGLNGNEVILHLSGAGEVVGSYRVSTNLTHCATAQAVEPCVALVWDSSTFEKLQARIPLFRRNLVRALEDPLLEMEQRFREVSTETNVEKKQPIRVVIADDHPIFREGVRRLLEAEPDHKVIGEASDGAEAVKLVRQLKPDILLLDLGNAQTGLDPLRELSTPANATPVRVILIAAPIEKSQIVEALQLGARGVVLIGSATQVLLKAIQTVMAGEYWVLRESFSNLSQYLLTPVQSMYEEVRQKFQEVRQKFGLTPQELDIVSAVVEGYSNKEIAEYLKIGKDTVKRHLSNIFDKVGVSSRLDLALFAVNQGLPLKSIEGPPAHSPAQTYNAHPAIAEACSRCGTEFLLGSRFCYNCGKSRPERSSLRGRTPSRGQH